MVLCSVSAKGYADSVTITTNAMQNVVPGNSIDLKVRINTRKKVEQVQISSQLGAAQSRGRVSLNVYNYTLNVNQDVPIGSYTISATVVLNDGSRIFGTIDNINLETDQTFNSIRFKHSTIMFNYVGEERPISVKGFLNNGDEIDLTDSSRVTFHSSDPDIIKVLELDKSLISARSGNATVIAKYNDDRLGYELQDSMVVNVYEPTISGDFNRTSVVDISDFKLLMKFTDNARRRIPVKISNDSRDLNHDLFIDRDDILDLINLCKYPNCNFRPLAEGEATPTPLTIPTPTPTATPSP